MVVTGVGVGGREERGEGEVGRDFFGRGVGLIFPLVFRRLCHSVGNLAIDSRHMGTSFEICCCLQSIVRR